MKDKNAYKNEYSAINKFINFMLFLAKYAALIGCVVAVAITIFLSIMLVMKGKDIPIETLTETIGFVTNMASSEVTNHVATLGTIKVAIAFTAYSASIALSMGLLRVILVKYKDVFNSIVSGTMYDATTLESMNDCIPLSILLTFVEPVIMFVVISVIGIFDYNAINVSGIIFLAISYIGKLLIENGNALYKRNLRLSKEISDIKAYETELKLSALKKQALVKQQEKVMKKSEEKKVTKKVSPNKKEVAKKVAPKKLTKTVSKKTTTK